MLDKNRLYSIPLLRQNGWQPTNRTDLKQKYAELERMYQKNQNICYVPQVTLKEIFPAARQVIESFEGICIKNFHFELGMGRDSNIIEFGFFISKLERSIAFPAGGQVKLSAKFFPILFNDPINILHFHFNN